VIRVRCGEVLSVIEETSHRQLLRVLVEGAEFEAVSFPPLVGVAAAGDQVTLNTSAVALSLGTGGQHFVMAIAGAEKDLSGKGHIMKVRYTPSQVQVLAVEEEASPYHDTLCLQCSLDNLPVSVATLHSLIAPFAVAFKRTWRAILPKVLLPSSPYFAASGDAPTPTESKTIIITREIRCICHAPRHQDSYSIRVSPLAAGYP
jgi:hypothetical protein